MKSLLFVLFLLLFKSSNSQSASQSVCDCNESLKKDRISKSYTFRQQIAYLYLIDERRYNELITSKNKNETTGLEIELPIISSLFSSTNSYSEFSKKRDEYMKFIHSDYKMNYQEAKNETFVVTQPVVYSFWLKCVQTCVNANTKGVIYWVDKEDSNVIVIKMRYIPSPEFANPKALKLTGTITNGYFGLSKKDTILKNENVKPNADKELIIRRIKGVNTMISLNAGDVFPFTYVSNYKKHNPTSATLLLTYSKPIDDKFIRAVTNYTITRDNHEKGCEDGFPCWGKYRATNNEIRLPTLTETNQIYKNLREPVCKVPPDHILSTQPKIWNLSREQLNAIYRRAFLERCNWNYGNSDKFQMTVSITENRKSAISTFQSSSGPTYWEFSADVYETNQKTSDTSYVPISKHFVFTVDTLNWKDCIMKFTINNSEYVLRPGESRPEVGIHYVTHRSASNGIVYEYDLNYQDIENFPDPSMINRFL